MMATTRTVAPHIQKILDEMVRLLIQHYQPERIVLYGSLAWGDFSENSDIDLLIVKETDETPLERRVRVRRIVADKSRHIPFSPLVITPQELEQRLALGDPFYRKILFLGTELYARS